MLLTRRSRGFTLVEVLVALAMIGVALVLTLPLLSLSIERGAQARKLAGAQYLAQDILERLRAEVRYDSTNQSPSTLSAADAWKFDVLPHAPNAESAGPECQPAGNDDGVVYDYGPFLFEREDEVYTVCYELQAINPLNPVHANLPAGSVEATVRVLWRSPLRGWSSWSLTDLLVSGD